MATFLMAVVHSSSFVALFTAWLFALLVLLD